jgi:hypothetical protein
MAIGGISTGRIGLDAAARREYPTGAAVYRRAEERPLVFAAAVYRAILLSDGRRWLSGGGLLLRAMSRDIEEADHA